MSYIDIWTRTAMANQDTPEHRFVDYWGNLGGATGVSTKDTQQGRALPILTIGEINVAIANGQTIAVGDTVSGNAEGFAVKSETGVTVLEVFQNFAKVLLR